VAGRPGWTMTLNYCRETVANKGITDVTRFEQEVKKCFANPVTYPPQADVVATIGAATPRQRSVRCGLLS
jgi:hypothetical protein